MFQTQMGCKAPMKKIVQNTNRRGLFKARCVPGVHQVWGGTKVTTGHSRKTQLIVRQEKIVRCVSEREARGCSTMKPKKLTKG